MSHMASGGCITMSEGEVQAEGPERGLWRPGHPSMVGRNSSGPQRDVERTEQMTEEPQQFAESGCNLQLSSICH